MYIAIRDQSIYKQTQPLYSLYSCLNEIADVACHTMAFNNIRIFDNYFSNSDTGTLRSLIWMIKSVSLPTAAGDTRAVNPSMTPLSWSRSNRSVMLGRLNDNCLESSLIGTRPFSCKKRSKLTSIDPFLHTSHNEGYFHKIYSICKFI